MKKLIMSGLAKAVADLLLFPVLMLILWSLLVHFRAAELVGWPTPTTSQIALLAFVGVIIR